MSTYQDCQNLINNLSNLKMDTRDDTSGDSSLSPSNASPPDFDFNLPCRFFKSSFARSLSLTNASSNSNNTCKSLDYDMHSNNGNSNNNKLSCLKRDKTTAVAAVPPLPQRRLSQAGSFYQQNEATSTSEQKQVADEQEKPPALPARRPLSLHNLTLPQNLSVSECHMNAEQKLQQQQNVLTQLRQQAYKQATNNSNNNSIMPVNGNTNNNNNNNNNNKNYNNQSTQQPTLNQKPQSHHFTAPNSVCNQNIQNNNGCNSSSVNNNNNKNNHFRRNIINNNNNHTVWSHQQKNVEQVETSCDMYRAVMEEVARFLERYQSQKQLQQQQQQQQLQQQQMAAQKHNNTININISNSNNNSNSNKMEQIPRSKSLFQVYVAGGHEKSANGNSNLDETSTSLSSTSSTSTSYLRARSSTNLIDLKHQQLNGNCNSKSNDDHNYETCLTPSQSYSAFKDFTWRRSPKKSDSRLNTAKDDVEEKLNQEAFRLLRTIHNLLNTSQHQPDLAHHRHSLAPAAALQMGRLSKALSTTSVMTLPGPPMLNSTSLTIGANSAGSSTPDSSTASPTISTANNAASNNLAPEMLFLRSANMRDSRLSLRSSTDSSVHSTSSAASSASSKVETDEEHSTPFHSPPNALTHKQHHHLAGSSTEDESGFSSISSFPDIGVPLSSTLLSSTPSSSKGRSMAKELKSLKANERDRDLQTTDSRNSTLKANVVGLPLNSSQDMSHRWDSPSKTYHNASNKFQRFSALANEDSNTVLWV
ncbi:rho GTPase-activating protein gacU isoform X2 [Calliphora vicina]|uniref:rho GTPase-activating protein gacU isoform X2 n=1 Tax=Calliphora vicina TaxID=7373 RepID=UPI00325B0F77